MRTFAKLAMLAGVAMLFTGMLAKAAAAPDDKEIIELTGILVKVSAVGAETTGWELHMANPVTIDGQTVKAVELDGDAKKFQKLENLRIGVKGIVTHRPGTETGDRIVIKVQKIKENV
ncbi:MAG TPA: hypothetical protein VL128_13675 [Candidatus Eisenbacteria bacterium]|nr:hypothetical protein [Candidatus Eisenbacteria bacterium]